MEHFSIEQASPSPTVAMPWSRLNRTNSMPVDNNTPNTTYWHQGSRLISLKKYSTAICLIEALTIAFLIYLLARLPPPSDQLDSRTLNKRNNVSDLNSPYRIYYSSANGLSSTVLPGLAPNCSQRRHDLAFSVRCKSSQIDKCHAPSTSQENLVKTYEQTLDATVKSTGGSLPVEIIETSKQGSRMERREVNLKRIECHPKHATSSSSNIDKRREDGRCRLGTRVEIDRYKGHQKIIGWGGALTDSSINNILSLTVNGTRRLLDDYFGPDGLLFNLVRVTIGGSDFSARFYTNEDQGDLFQKRFELKEEDYLYKIPMLRMVTKEYNLRRIKLFASMWSPPVWMKTNNHFNKGQLKGSIDDEPLFNRRVPDTEKYFEALADLKMNWLLEYHAEKVDFWGLTVMNEPIFAVQPFLNFNTMIFPSEDYANYVAKYLGPKLKAQQTTKHIKLMVHDDNRRFLLNFTEPILNERRVRQFVDGVTVHGYVDEEYPFMDLIYNKYKDADRTTSDENQNDRQADDWFVLPTELCSGHLPIMEKALIGNWHRGVHYALDIIHSLQNSAAGWVDWNMVLDTEGGPGWLGGRLDAPIIVDKSQDLYHKSPMFYVLGQFSRFIPPGSQRIETRVVNDLYDNHFEVVSFKLADQPNKAATVIVNNNPYKIEALLRTASNGKQASKPMPDGVQVYHLIECPADSVITVIHNLN